MKRPPRPASEPVLTRRHWRVIGAYGLLMTASVLATFGIALRRPEVSDREAVTISFLTLALCQLWHVLNMRHSTSPMLRNEITRNPWVWGALLLCVSIVLCAIYTPPLARFLSIEQPSATSWKLILIMSAVPLLVGQTVMWMIARIGGRRDRRASPVPVSP